MTFIAITIYATVSLVIGIAFCEAIRRGKAEAPAMIEHYVTSSPSMYLVMVVVVAAVWPVMAAGAKISRD